MIIPFSQMPPNAKVWIYASNQIISPSQLAIINQKAVPFIENWTSHQSQLKAEFAVLHNCFLVIMVDESFNEIGGCSVDKSIHLIREIEAETGLNLLNRLAVQLLENNEVSCHTKAEVLSKIASQELSNSVKTFNNQLTLKSNFDTEWIIPLSQAWFFVKNKTQTV